MMLQGLGLAVVMMLGAGVADEVPASHRAPPPNISAACLAKMGPKQNSSIWHSSDKKEMAAIISSWGVLTNAPPTPFNELIPGAGATISQASKGEYYSCQEYSDDFNFWSVSVGKPSSSSGRRRRSSTDAQDRSKSEGELYMEAITDSLTSIAQHPADVATKRRRLQGWRGGGSSVGMCLPNECSKQDVKIITGYYWYWMKCGHIIAPSGGGGGGAGFRRALQGGGLDQLAQLKQCGQTNCPMPSPPPPPLPPMKEDCEVPLFRKCSSKRSKEIECTVCLVENKADLGNCTEPVKKAFCTPAPPAPPFDPVNCYYEACPKTQYGDGDSDEEDYGYDGGYIAEGRRRLFGGWGGGGGSCPTLEEPVPLDGAGKFWVVYICITVAIIALASTPAPYGLRGCLPGAPGGPKPSIQAGTTASPRFSQEGAPLAPLTSAGVQAELKKALLTPPPQRPAAAPGGAAGKMFLEVMNCWSFQRNYNALFKPDPGIPGMSVLNGMRVLAIMCVVLGHTWAFMRMDVTNQGYGQLVAARESAIGIIGNGHVMDNGTGVSYLSVDTFFFFSGFLAFYSLLTSVLTLKWETPKKTVMDCLKYIYAVIMHRYLRLTPMYFFILMVYMHVWPAFGNGPNWKESTDMTFCNKWWWTNILYISNLYPCQFWELKSSNPDNDWGTEDYAQCSNGDGELGCMIQTWYLSNDFQMFLAVVPCALLFRWKVWAAYAYNAALTLGCLWWGYANMSKHFMTMCDMMICGGRYGRRLLDSGLGDPATMDALSADAHRQLQGYGYGNPSFCDDHAKADVQVFYYDKPWARYPPYGVGVMLAIMLMHIRREPGVAPAAVKFLSNGVPDVNNKIAKPPKMNVVVVVIGWALALGLLFYCSFGPYYAIPTDADPHHCPWGGSYTQAPEDADGYAIGHGTRTHSFWDLTFSTCFRMWWAIGVAWIVWASMAEQGGPIGAFLGSSFWQPIKNLTFGVYLCHIMIIDLLYYSMGKDFDYTDYFGAYIFTANYTLACAGAAALWFLVEKPFANLVPMILMPRRR